MIPKIIHYIWFGGSPLPEYARKNIETWKKFNPEYEIKEWNESNIDVAVNKYAHEVYNSGKWGFVGDFIRHYVLYNFGGIYLDVDVECFKPFDDLLNNKAVLCFEGKYHLSNAVMMSERRNPLFLFFLEQYKNRHFKVEDKNFWGCGFDLTSGPAIMTVALMKYNKKHFIKNGYYEFASVAIFPQEYLSPSIWANQDNHLKSLTSKTYTIHHFEGSWKTSAPRLLTGFQKIIIKIRFLLAHRLVWLFGNKFCVLLEQSTYQLTLMYDKKNRMKGKKNISPW